jgi:hypothetical protein
MVQQENETAISKAQLINGAARFHQMRHTRGPRSGGPSDFSVSSLATRSTGRCTWLAAAAGDVRRPRHCRMRPSAGWGDPSAQISHAWAWGSCPCLHSIPLPHAACFPRLPQLSRTGAGHCCELNSMQSLIFYTVQVEARLGIVTCNQHLGSTPPDPSDSGDGCNCHCIP